MATFKDNLTDLYEAQDAEYDVREEAIESDHFINHPEGMWDPYLAEIMNERPRYTFDRITPIVDQIMGEMSQAQFSVKVRPAGHGASSKTAKLMDGLVRNIEAMSNATQIYHMAAREAIVTGISGWRVYTDWCNEDAFDQDFRIKFISNFVNRVWFDPNYEEPTASDADYCFIQTAMTKQAYEKKYPEGSGQSINTGHCSTAYDHHKPGEILIGERLYKVRKKRNLYLMSNGAIFEEGEKFDKIRDELEAKGITVERERKRAVTSVVSRRFDGDDWLDNKQETVFRYLPVIPCLNNFELSENKAIYSGIVRKLKDANRVLNFSESRKIEEVALSPRPKYWATAKQVGSYLADMEQLNVSNKSVQLYDPDERVPGPPTYQGGAIVNPGLVETSAAAINHISASGGMFSANMGDSPASRSGVAINNLQDRGNNGAYKYFVSLQRALQHTGRLIVDAIPRVYDTPREMRMINPDGSHDTSVINRVIMDVQTMSPVVINDLSKGTYDVVCDIGPAFRNRQEESVKALTELAKVDPTILQIAGDILLNNITAPGIDEVAERKRWLMIKQGAIPKDQMTQEEQQRVAKEKKDKAQRPPEPIEKAQMMLAKAEIQKAQADIAEVKSKTSDRMEKVKLEMIKLQQKEREVQLKERESMLKIQKEQNQQILDAIKGQSEDVKVQAEALATLIKATGADAYLSPTIMKAIDEQAQIVLEEQKEL